MSATAVAICSTCSGTGCYRLLRRLTAERRCVVCHGTGARWHDCAREGCFG